MLVALEGAAGERDKETAGTAGNSGTWCRYAELRNQSLPADQ